jgi:hypothetical protein
MDPRPIFVVTTAQAFPPISSSPPCFANGTYLMPQTAFALPTRAGEIRHVRWSLVPETPFEVDRLRQGRCAGM